MNNNAFVDFVYRVAEGLDVADSPEASNFEDLYQCAKKDDSMLGWLTLNAIYRMTPYNVDMAMLIVENLVRAIQEKPMLYQIEDMPELTPLPTP